MGTWGTCCAADAIVGTRTGGLWVVLTDLLTSQETASVARGNLRVATRKVRKNRVALTIGENDGRADDAAVLSDERDGARCAVLAAVLDDAHPCRVVAVSEHGAEAYLQMLRTLAELVQAERLNVFTRTRPGERRAAHSCDGGIATAAVRHAARSDAPCDARC